jgi:anti-anti-sigma regulatory factor
LVPSKYIVVLDAFGWLSWRKRRESADQYRRHVVREKTRFRVLTIWPDPDGVAVIAPQGPLDTRAAALLIQVIRYVTRERGRRAVVDLGRVSRIDADAAQVLRAEGQRNPDTQFVQQCARSEAVSRPGLTLIA